MNDKYWYVSSSKRFEALVFPCNITLYQPIARDLFFRKTIMSKHMSYESVWVHFMTVVVSNHVSNYSLCVLYCHGKDVNVVHWSTWSPFGATMYWTLSVPISLPKITGRCLPKWGTKSCNKSWWSWTVSIGRELALWTLCRVNIVNCIVTVSNWFAKYLQIGTQNVSWFIPHRWWQCVGDHIVRIQINGIFCSQTISSRSIADDICIAFSVGPSRFVINSSGSMPIPYGSPSFSESPASWNTMK